MSKIEFDDDQSFKDSLIQSLCYLFQEAIKEERQDLANVLQWAIEQAKRTPEEMPLSPQSLDCLHQFYVLRKFQGFSMEQKQMFIRGIDYIEEQLGAGSSEGERPGV